MRAVAPSILFSLLAWSCPGSAAESPMAGTWEVKWKCAKAVNPDCMPDTFSIRLFIQGGKLCGTHSSIAKAGKKVDEIGGSKPTLSGQVVGATATVTFLSAFEGKGKATITLRGERLQWHIVEEEGESWLPPDATLHRIPNSAWGSSLRCETLVRRNP